MWWTGLFQEKLQSVWWGKWTLKTLNLDSWRQAVMENWRQCVQCGEILPQSRFLPFFTTLISFSCTWEGGPWKMFSVCSVTQGWDPSKLERNMSWLFTLFWSSCRNQNQKNFIYPLRSNSKTVQPLSCFCKMLRNCFIALILFALSLSVCVNTKSHSV